MNLQEQGFRFVCRARSFCWVHPAEVNTTDIDCTDMDDAQFDVFVKSTTEAA